MKKTKSFQTMVFGLILLTSNELLSQGTTWNLTGNNNATSSTFVGTTTSQPLIFRTNNTERLRISQTGQFMFSGLGTTGTGFLTTNSSGQLQRTTFTGNSNQVLLGDGTFGNLPASYFTLNGTNLLNTPYKLGIGVLYPTEMLEVNGNGVFNGTITTQKVIISDVAMASDRLLFRNSGMLMEGYNSADGTRNEIVSVSQPLYINSMSSMFQNTIINSDNSGKVGIGTTSPQEKFDLAGNAILRDQVFIPSISEEINPSFLMTYDNSTGKLTKTNPEDILKIIYAPLGEAGVLLPCKNIANPTWANGYAKIFVKCPDVKVGIGLDNPSHSLTVNGSAKIFNHIWAGSGLSVGADENTYTKAYIKNNTRTATLFLDARENTGSYQKLFYAEFNDPTTEIINAYNFNGGYSSFYVKANGQVYVHNGTHNTFQLEPNGQLTINSSTQKILQLEQNGMLRARRLKLDTDNWADYVFEPNYKLMPLEEVEAFVKQEKHLPNVPSEKELKENGTDVMEMNKVLMEKVEELTLYLIEQNKQIEAMKVKMAELEATNK